MLPSRIRGVQEPIDHDILQRLLKYLDTRSGGHALEDNLARETTGKTTVGEEKST